VAVTIKKQRGNTPPLFLVIFGVGRPRGGGEIHLPRFLSRFG
jgi:hypothetical protein